MEPFHTILRVELNVIELQAKKNAFADDPNIVRETWSHLENIFSRLYKAINPPTKVQTLSLKLVVYTMQSKII